VSDENNKEILSRMFRDMCPVTDNHMPSEEKETLLTFVAEVMNQRDEYEGQLSLVQKRSRRESDMAARARDILLQYAACIPDEATDAEDSDEVEIRLPGRLARPLCRMGQDVTVAEAAKMLSGKRGMPHVKEGYIYPNPVVAHDYSKSGKALHVQDSATGEDLWIATSQILRHESQVNEPGDAGMLVVTKWLAAQKGWKT
jgi:hypothetical protein